MHDLATRRNRKRLRPVPALPGRTAEIRSIPHVATTQLHAGGRQYCLSPAGAVFRTYKSQQSWE